MRTHHLLQGVHHPPDHTRLHPQHAVGETVRETQGETVRETQGETVRETQGETVRETQGETVRETQGETVRESSTRPTSRHAVNRLNVRMRD
jgi:uncharacterized protein involved in type VI secretion and phage assembly